MKRRRLVIVRWDDAWSCMGKREEASLMKGKPARVATTGYVVRDDKTCIVLAHCAQRKIGEWKNVTFIPRAYIRTVLPYHLKVGRKLPVCRVKGLYSCP